MTLKNNRAPLLGNIKLYVSFHHHMWIQTGVTVRKRLSWVANSVTQTETETQTDSNIILFNINTYWDRYIRLQKKHGGKSKIDKKPDMVNMHVVRPLLRSCLTAYIEATLGGAHGQECQTFWWPLTFCPSYQQIAIQTKNHSSTCHM